MARARPPAPRLLVPPGSLTVRETADRFGVAIPTVYHWIESGYLVAMPASRSRVPRLRITPEALEEFLATRVGRKYRTETRAAS